ncbi:hypothetical protein PCANB_000195 [Pneumocystis canis]|nr:hypothetical protein PCANB_000195 [Pneumocystis canis]
MYLLWMLIFSYISFCHNISYSFVSPFGETLLENWDFYGSIKIHQNKIILAPISPEPRIASIWSKHRNIYEEWSVEIISRLTSLDRENTGFALWYTSDKGKGGLVFGSKDLWDGLGLFLFVGPDKKTSLRGHLNDGSIEYSSFKNPISQAFGACSINYPNINETLVFKLSYFQGIIHVEQNNTICFRTTQINLPPNYYFGISVNHNHLTSHRLKFQDILFKSSGVTRTI